MVKDNNFIKESSSIIEEIEAQLQDVLSKKKLKVEQELEEKIKAEQEEAQKKISEIESELKGEKEALTNYKNVLSQFESDKEEVKNQIKGHLDKAIQLQTEIEQMTGKTLHELKTVSDLTKKLDEINQEASSRVNALKTELEDKYGIIAQVPESNGQDEVDIDLENELAKLQKIKELLGPMGIAGRDVKEEPNAEAESESGSGASDAGEESEEEETEEAEAKAGNVNEEAPEKPEDEANSEAEPEAETETKEAEDTENEKNDKAFKTAFEALDQYRKSEDVEGNGYMVFYENKGKIILDGESFVAYLNNNLEEVKKLYNKLQETESPKDQFFTKQEIIKKQDVLRKYMLSFIGKGELEVSDLPSFTKEILNIDVLKNILEKVSMENWSNQEDFMSFDKLTNDLKESFYAKITPPDKYLESIKEELESD